MPFTEPWRGRYPFWLWLFQCRRSHPACCYEKASQGVSSRATPSLRSGREFPLFLKDRKAYPHEFANCRSFGFEAGRETEFIQATVHIIVEPNQFLMP